MAIHQGCTSACLLCLSVVVGVKLNVSFWMNSFMNATLKLNVSDAKRWAERV